MRRFIRNFLLSVDSPQIPQIVRHVRNKIVRGEQDILIHPLLNDCALGIPPEVHVPELDISIR